MIKRYHLSSEPRPSSAEVLPHPDWEKVSLPSAVRSYRVSTVIDVDKKTYTVSHDPESSLRLTQSFALAPITVLNCARLKLTPEYAHQKLRHFLAFDSDVTTKALFTTVLLIGQSHTDDLSDAFLDALGSHGCEIVFTAPGSAPISEGPYFYNTTGLYRAFRLQSDDQEAFISSTTAEQQEDGSYVPLAAKVGDSHTLAVAIPSRLHRNTTTEQPLAGLRIAIKDIFHLKGTHTGGGNRAYRSLYPVQDTTSHAVELAIRKGCIPLGKTKTAEFGGSQEVCGDWIDYSYPLNCRADGYLVATGSSTGSAAALAAYDFLDITIGTDAGGSIRDPATAQGLFGLRPSHDGTVEKYAIVPCARFQRSGYFARDLQLLHNFVQHAVEIPASSKTSIRRVVFPSNYWAKNPVVQDMCSKFVHSLARFLGTRPSYESIERTWDRTKPSHINGDFFEYFDTTFITLLSNDYWKDSASFRDDYKNENGRDPYISPTTRWLWGFGSSRTAEQLEDAARRVKIHNDWVNEYILGSNDTGRGTVIVMPKFNSDRRDEYWSPPTQRHYNGFDSNLHASFAGLANLVVPIGQIPFKSPISGVEEQLPVSVSIATSRGQDLALLQLVIDFLQADNRPTLVRTGRTAFET